MQRTDCSATKPDQLGQSSRAEAAVLRLGIFGWNLDDLRPLFDALAERRPDSEVRIRVLTFADPFGPLRAGERDAMLPWLPIREPDLTVGPVVFTEPIVMAMSTTDPLAQQDSVSLEAFADRTVIVGAAPDYWRHTPASPTRSSATHHSPVSRLSGAPPPKPISSEPLPASSPSWAR